jgi:hypothetical protein
MTKYLEYLKGRVDSRDELRDKGDENNKANIEQKLILDKLFGMMT